MAFPNDVLSSVTYSAPFRGARNNSITHLRDYEDGGIALNDPSQGLEYQQWHARLINNQVLVTAPNTAEFVLFSESGLEEISLAFDQNMRYCLAYVQSGQAKMKWYDTTVGNFSTLTLPSGSITPRVALDDKRSSQLGNSDIILAYVRDCNLYFRKQRDRFLIEYLLSSNVGYGLMKVGMNTLQRFQFEFDPFRPCS